MTDAVLMADLVALVHLAFVGFVVLGQVAILAGWAAGWTWTRAPRFRWLHLGAIGVVVLQVLAGAYCPLTLLEMRLRGETAAGHETFVGYWVDRLLYYDVALWQTHVAYVLFAALVLWTFIRYPPRRPRAR